MLSIKYLKVQLMTEVNYLLKEAFVCLAFDSEVFRIFQQLVQLLRRKTI